MDNLEQTKDTKKKKDTKKEKKKYRAKRIIKPTTFFIIFMSLFLVINLAVNAYRESKFISGDLSYTEYQEMLANGEIEKANIVNNSKTFKVTTTDGETYEIVNPGHPEFKREILESGIAIEVADITLAASIGNLVLALPSILLLIIICVMVANMLSSSQSTLFKVLKPEEIVTFDEVAGMSETKKEIEFAISQIKNRHTLNKLGAHPCKGIILEGPPGTGKTLLAKAIAGEAGVPFISVCGSDFEEMFVGLGASRVRSLWTLATTNAPCVIFIDEIDAIGHKRSGGGDAVSVDRNQTLNALLQKMDGVGGWSGIFVIGATNRVADLDPALLRPGRFDKHLYIGPPKTKADRDEIIKVHIKEKIFDANFDFDAASKLMFGLTGAEIEQVLNEAVMVSIQDEREGKITLNDIDVAAMKLRSSGVLIQHSSESDRIISAVHEAGHAILGLSVGRKISKVSIMPYSSGIGGMTVEDTDGIEDKKLKTKAELIQDIEVLLAGREAEQLLLGDTSIGCSNDIERASKLAFQVINNFAMTDGRLVNISFLQELGGYRLDTESIVKEVDSLLRECQQRVILKLKNNIDNVEDLKGRLLLEETVTDVNI